MSFIEKVGKPQNWSAMGCDGLTQCFTGGSLLVPEPLAAVPSAAARPCLPGRGRMPRRAGSPFALAGKGCPGHPPMSFTPPLPAPPGWRTRRQIGRHPWRVQLPGWQIQRTMQWQRTSEVEPKMIFMGHEISSCGSQLIFHLVQDFGIIVKYLLCSPCKAWTYHLVLSWNFTWFCQISVLYCPNFDLYCPKIVLYCPNSDLYIPKI